jgi:hypothetical protein
MEDPAYLAGKLTGFGLLAIPALFFLDRSFRANHRSLRLTNLALFLGLLIFVLPELAFGWTKEGRPGPLLVSGIIRIALALTGMGLAIAGLAIKADGGVGYVRPFIAGGCCFLLLLIGLCSLFFAAMNAPSEPWTYQAPNNEYRLTLPSKQWKQLSSFGGPGLVVFARDVPQMHARVFRVKQQQTREDYEHDVRAFVSSSRISPDA